MAARAGVGAITVSRALRNPAQVSATLRALIDEAVRELNYVPDLHARALASTRTDVLAVLVPSLSHTVFTDVLRGIYDGVDGTKLHVQLGNTRFDPQEEERLLAGFVRQKPSAIIVSGVDQTPASRRMLEEAGCPVVQIMDVTDDPIQVVIGFRHREAGRRMTEHLIQQGYRSIAFISGWMSGRSLERLYGYQEALAAAGLSEPCKVHSLSKDELTALASRADSGVPPFLEFSRPSLGREMFRRAKELAPGLDAVFCNNDSLALGVLFECHAQGIRVPEDIGIAGFNDLDFMDACYPSLSSVRTHRYRNGYAAVTAVRQMLQGSYEGPRVVDLGVEVMARQSTLRRGPDRA
ncbi:LacI family DNA-binding transcriptional regulator [uncultured Alsobacter sp.]|uniref:LacI family DNA-binding transcriptional regulator n=1 Tax=uncultured Alsobacter sp. TaxID=1748258 RepID=UPI0025DBA214|nr:LacI family DNA-binding transcriptional regulator [uncultured Alsobacter sp.]